MDKTKVAIYGIMAGVFVVYACFAKYCIDRQFDEKTKKDIELAKINRDIANNYNKAVSKIMVEESE